MKPPNLDQSAEFILILSHCLIHEGTNPGQYRQHPIIFSNLIRLRLWLLSGSAIKVLPNIPVPRCVAMSHTNDESQKNDSFPDTVNLFKMKNIGAESLKLSHEWQENLSIPYNIYCCRRRLPTCYEASMISNKRVDRLLSQWVTDIFGFAYL